MVAIKPKPKLVYAIRIGGFTPISWPVISMPRYGKSECKKKSSKLATALSEQSNSCVVVLGSNQARKSQRGKIIAIACLTDTVVKTESVVAPELTERHHGDHGFKHPWGVKIDHVIFFTEPLTDSKKVFGADELRSIPRNKYRRIDNQKIINGIWNLPTEPAIYLDGNGGVKLGEVDKSGKGDASR